MTNILDQFAPHGALAAPLLQHLSQAETDTAHDLSHILRVWQNVRAIARTDGGDLRVLAAATLLHDIVNPPKDAPNRQFASRMSASQAADILSQLGEDAAFIDQVAHAIEAHSFSAGITPKTLEAQILQDADRLDALGYIGVARCLAVSGGLGRAIYDPLDPTAKDRALDDQSFAMDHFQSKLLHLKDGFQTPTGRSLAEARHNVIQDFYNGLMQEVGAP